MKAAAILFILAGSTAWTVYAQGQVFEVASVKPNHSGENMRSFPRMVNGTFTAQSASLMTLLTIAYGLDTARIEAPSWFSTEKYDVNAKAPAGVADTQIMPLLQSLLRDRLHLDAHLEMKEMQVYDLLVGKDGSKLTPFDPATRPQTPPNRGQAVLTGNGGTTGSLANSLSNITGRPVIDKTSIEGRFSWVLSFAPLTSTGIDASVAPDLFVALPEQLGLKLVASKALLETLVVDHAERVPTDN